MIAKTLNENVNANSTSRPRPRSARAEVVVHGGHLREGEDAAVGFDNWRKCVDGLDLPIPLLIENTAGGDNAMARRLEAIERLWEAIGRASGADQVGFCLDTCHAHAGGNDLGTVADRVRAITGRIDLVHANDSRGAFDSGADRHTGIGSGHIDRRLRRRPACRRPRRRRDPDRRPGRRHHLGAGAPGLTRPRHPVRVPRPCRRMRDR